MYRFILCILITFYVALNKSDCISDMTVYPTYFDHIGIHYDVLNKSDCLSDIRRITTTLVL